MFDGSKRDRDAIADVFGEHLPQISADERDAPSPEDHAERDRWLRENLPPHHL
ncbi:hypothetical protein H7I77_15280 [Mycolicibacterium novocastrense]|uniref:Uncharacterized protein n=1 Tax=Mycolicibacterium novocastrense TaxID=59813 RepID=A0AAW5SLL8_MYCNV|nr:hypothetical protein [Mycolicibacterium novocastrense]MCV7024693.1 hypothetical protein [Mycolicibacterium novocastrense]